jgi:midasin
LSDAAAAADASTGLLLVERGDVCVVPRHPGFRLVAAMNPATDAGKRDLPPQLRSRFTEFWVGEPRSREDLGQLVGGYLAGAAPAPPVDAVVGLYLAAKTEAVSGLGSTWFWWWVAVHECFGLQNRSTWLPAAYGIDCNSRACLLCASCRCCTALLLLIHYCLLLLLLSGIMKP